MKKKEYHKPVTEVIRFQPEDVITTSPEKGGLGGGNGSGNGFNWPWWNWGK